MIVVHAHLFILTALPPPGDAAPTTHYRSFGYSAHPRLGAICVPRPLAFIDDLPHAGRSGQYDHLGPRCNLVGSCGRPPSDPPADARAGGPAQPHLARTCASGTDCALAFLCFLRVHVCTLKAGTDGRTPLVWKAWKSPSLPYEDLHPLADYDASDVLCQVGHYKGIADGRNT